jgi:CBS domain-containing protein/sporulation protein YlmC with PRC-barrel domain
MIYFSELRGRTVSISRNGQTIPLGRLDDLIFTVSDHPTITKAVLVNSQKKKMIVPFESVKKNHTLLLTQPLDEEVSLDVNELYINQNLVDHQIIDISGNKVVKVNDVAIRDDLPIWAIAGVDIGILGILRWFGLERIILRIGRKLGLAQSSELLAWAYLQPMELTSGQVVLKSEQEKLKKLQPEDLADHLERTNYRNARKILNLVDDEFAAEVIQSLKTNYQLNIFRPMKPAKAATIISLMDPDEAVDILLGLRSRLRLRILNSLSPKKKKELESLMTMSDTAIGGLMTSEYVTVFPDQTVKQALRSIKEQAQEFEYLEYIYVVNHDNNLVGALSVRDLLFEKSDTELYRFMNQDMVVAHLTTPEEVCASRLIKYKLHALPVVDKGRKLVGIITLDDLGDFLEKKLKL